MSQWKGHNLCHSKGDIFYVTVKGHILCHTERDILSHCVWALVLSDSGICNCLWALVLSDADIWSMYELRFFLMLTSGAVYELQSFLMLTSGAVYELQSFLMLTSGAVYEPQSFLIMLFKAVYEPCLCLVTKTRAACKPCPFCGCVICNWNVSLAAWVVFIPYLVCHSFHRIISYCQDTTHWWLQSLSSYLWLLQENITMVALPITRRSKGYLRHIENIRCFGHWFTMSLWDTLQGMDHYLLLFGER